MKLKDLDFIDKDYKRLKKEWETESYDTRFYDIKNYFDVCTNDFIELANTTGVTACSEYVDFVTSTVFPFDATWVTARAKEEGKEHAAEMAADYLNAKLAEGGFYREILKLVKQGALYNKGMLQTTFEKGLNFKCVENEMIFAHKSSNPAAQRAYSDSYVTMEEVLASYEGEVIGEVQTTLNVAQNKDALYMRATVVTAVLPTSKFFYDTKGNVTKGKFKREYFLLYNDKLRPIKKTSEGEQYYQSFPVMCYLPNYDGSLAAQALVAAETANSYEMLIMQFARKILKPTIGIGIDTFTNNVFDLGEAGLVPLQNYERAPAPIESAQRFNITEKEIQRNEMKIQKTFKLDLIQRVNVTNLSQFEAAANELAAIKAVLPAASDLVLKVPSMVLERAHSLLKKHDEKYRKLAAAAGEIDFSMSGITEKIKKLNSALGIGRVAQGLAPYVQIDPSSTQNIDGDKVSRTIAESWGVSEILAPKEQVEQERQQMAEAQQAQLQQQQQEAQSENDLRQAQATQAEAQAGAAQQKG